MPSDARLHAVLTSRTPNARALGRPSARLLELRLVSTACSRA